MSTLWSILGSGAVSAVAIVLFALITRSKTSAQTKKIAEEAGDLIYVRMSKELKAMAEQLDALKERGDVTDDYLLYDARWHRREELANAGTACELAEHTSFLEFERTRSLLKEAAHGDSQSNGHAGP